MTVTRVVNLKTRQSATYTLPPIEAVVAAHRQLTKGDYHTWNLPNYAHEAQVNGTTVSCGDWTADKG